MTILSKSEYFSKNANSNVYKYCNFNYNSNLMIVSMTPGDLKWLPDDYFFCILGGSNLWKIH